MIRVAEEQDAANLAELVISLAHFYLDENSPAELPQWFAASLREQAFIERISGPDFHSFVFEESERIVGYIAISDTSHLYHLFVSEQSQRKGIATQLWRYAIACSSASVYTVRSSINAVPVYKAFGFRCIGEAGSKDGLRFQPMELRNEC